MAMDKKLEKLIAEEGVSESTIYHEMASRPWRQQKNEVQERKEDTRSRIRNSSVPEGAVLRRPKPQPTINDSDYKRIAVYARVSTQSEEQVSSIENQTKYYTEKVAEKENWDLYKIYADEGKSGTSMKRRTEFKQMLQDAADQKFDTILCASVSRFARNVTDCIEQIKHLKTDNPRHPVGVYFETEGLYTLDPNSTMALFIHAMLADWESDNKSKRMILSYDQRICTGQYPVSDLLGYRHTKDGDLVIQEDEAITVRFIFLAYLGGYSLNEIAEILTENDRPTLTGRTEWNAEMVRAIMQNERRWGDLEARKNIVIDYKEKKTVKNYDLRVSAFVPDHHEGIVSREIANAVKMINASSGTIAGVPDISVISDGGLKGFVTVTPAWGGVNADLYRNFCKSAYTDDEFAQIEHEARIISGKEHSKIISMDFAGYEVPSSAFFIDASTPTLTFNRRNLKLNKKFHDRFAGVEYVEFLYHPLLQAIVVRSCDKSVPGAVALKSKEGKVVSSIPAAPFCDVVYEMMDWIEDYGFRFRGVTRHYGNQTAMLFFLDEPQILVGKGGVKAAGSANYIPYRKSELETEIPEEKIFQFGVSYAMRKKRDSIIKRLSDKDMSERGVVKENPLIGRIPTRQEIMVELDELLMSM